ncbi:Immunoglobulin I-set [Trinorchestia longiramus]|nr:Immunoglobulin I-set [Trinorchestia longiramus]
MGTQAACPKLCHCKWRDGKETVACHDADFIDIPRGLDSTTQVLDLHRNNLKILPSDAFLDTGLVNLQKVWLNFCKLKYISDGAFKHLANLIELDLSDNLLTTIPSKPLADVSGLRNLLIARNAITELPEEAFKSVPMLVKLDLSHNNISSVHENAFAFLNRLEDLKLSYNNLKTLPVNVLRPLAVLHGLHVDHNPWNCNCHLRLLRQWLLQRNVPASIPPQCHSPERLKGRKWRTLNEDEFVCVPLVTAVAQKVIASHGDNVTLACKVETDDEAAVTWLVGERTVVNASEEAQRKYSVLELGASGTGARVSNLTIEGAAVQDQGTYRCVAENKAGRVETNLTLKVSEEVTEVQFVAKKIKTEFPQWIFGVIAGAASMIIIIIIMVTYRDQSATCCHESPLPSTSTLTANLVPSTSSNCEARLRKLPVPTPTSASAPPRRHVHFEDTDASGKSGEGNTSPDSAHLLQYHVAELYKFLQEYKTLQEQLKTFRAEENSDNPSSSSINPSITRCLSTPAPDIQSSIEYLLAHQASIPTPVVDTINQLTNSREDKDETSPVDGSIVSRLPPPPNCTTSSPIDADIDMHIIPPPSDHMTCSSFQNLGPATLPSVIPPPATPSEVSKIKPTNVSKLSR